MKLVQVCLNAREDRERNFHDCGGAVKVVQTCLNARGDEESNFL